MKKNYYYVVMLGFIGDVAESVSIVKASSLKALAELGYRKTSTQDVYRCTSEEDAENFIKEYIPAYPKQRISYWV